MNAAEYDPKIIQEFSDRLYSQAKNIVASYTFFGELLLGAAGLGFGDGAVGLFGVFLGGAIGYYMGKEKAFGLKLQAQTALCQVQIEQNTKQITI